MASPTSNLNPHPNPDPNPDPNPNLNLNPNQVDGLADLCGRNP